MLATELTGEARMQAFGYVRVSTAEQTKEGVSLEAQQERIRAWQQQMGTS
jgi:DNA invertase Pin-like site-specific DNA recombinase